MQILRFDLRKEPTEHGFMPFLEVYRIDRFWEDCRRPMVVICPGGGYEHVCADREGERVALQYNAAGYHAAVVHYAICPHRAPEQLYELAEAFRIVRAHAEEWQLAPDKIAVCGFSAGGHLAASLSTLWDEPSLFSEEEIASRVCRPDASILCYPVITGGEKAHDGSFRALLGTDDKSDPRRMLYSCESQVDPDTPPAFLWHTVEDTCVPVENSILYASALREHGVLFELHIFPRGCHGMSLVRDEYIWSKRMFERDYDWMVLSVDFLNEQFGLV